jgi:hypothetical protein
MKKPRSNTESDATENNAESDATENNTESDATEKNTESDATVSLDLDDRPLVVDRLKVPPEHWPLPVVGRTPLPTGARIQTPLLFQRVPAEPLHPSLRTAATTPLAMGRAWCRRLGSTRNDQNLT